MHSSSVDGDVVITPRRRSGAEILDDPRVDPVARRRSSRDIVASNRWFGGRRAVLEVIDEVIRSHVASSSITRLTLLDVGTGLADIPHAAKRVARRHGVTLTTIGIDREASLLASAGSHLDQRVSSDALALPFADNSVDIAMCSQILHHFEHADAVTLVRELDRVASRHVIVSDLRRSWIAAGGFKLAAVALRFHPITHHDGVLSVMRGFTPTELGAIIEEATDIRTQVRRHLGYRLTATWTARHPARRSRVGIFSP